MITPISIINLLFIGRVMQGEKDHDYMFKLILLGATAVGKSQILLRFTKNQFSEGSSTTVGVEFATKLITTAQGSRIKFQIWDTAGQQKYQSLMKMYYRGASAALIVYDITSDDSFTKLDNQLRHIRQHFRGDIIKMIVGNKVDLQQQRAVSKQRGLQYAEQHKIAFYEVSAKENINIELIFTRMAEEFQKAISVQDPEPPQDRAKNGNHRSTKDMDSLGKKEEVLVLKKPKRQQQRVEGKKKKCCDM